MISLPDVACLYDWIISLDQEVAFVITFFFMRREVIHPAPWNAVKCAYLFCRYYPLAVAPFHFWGFVGDHEQRVCETYYPAIYACTIPMVLSAQFILMLRTYAFSGKKRWVLAVLSITLLGLLGVITWVMSKELSHQPTVNATGSISVKAPFGFRLGIISIIATFFDFLNIFIVVQRCIKERCTLGPLSQSFVKQGRDTGLPHHDGIERFDDWSFLQSCRLIKHSVLFRVLMLRRKASPTETELHFEHSHMINEALEMIEVTPKNFIPSISMAPRVSLDA
ncbi:hypothetical protein V8E53_006878 [Lactarius tabidus]